MKDYVERYIYAVTRRLPVNARDEVEAELRAHISDMLSEHPDEAEIDHVLHDLGHPRDIASNYDDRKRFVIAPQFYADYQFALKIGLVVVGVFALFFSALNALLTVDQENVWHAIGYVIEHVLNGTFNAVVYGFAIITIGFWIVSSDKLQKNIKPWQMKDLMEVPKDHKTYAYKRSKAIFALVFQVIFSTIFIVILLYYIHQFGIYDNGVLVAPLFDIDVIGPFILVIIIAEVLVVISQAMLVLQRKYTVPMLSVYTIGKVASSILTLVIIQNDGFITSDFITRSATNMGILVADLSHGIHVAVIVLTVLIVLGTIGDLFTQWRKLFKPLTKNEKKA